MEVYVFRTGVEKEDDIKKLAPHLNSLKGVYKWTFDLEDSENILRVEAAGIPASEIERILALQDCFCEELPD